MSLMYTDLQSGRVETTEALFSDLFLKARIKTGQESSKGYSPDLEGVKWNDRLLEDDVNVYIFQALGSLIDPVALKLMAEYAVSVHSDAGHRADKMRARSEKFLLYRVNADFLLLMLGMFKPAELPFHAYLDKGSAYYAAAAGYRQEIDGGRSPLVDVLEKLCIGFNRYVGLLRFMKYDDPNFFGIFRQLSRQDINEIEQIADLEVRLNQNKN